MFGLHPLEGHERKRDGARGLLGIGSRCSEMCILKAQESISDFVRDPRYMAHPNREIMFHRYEKKEPEKVHDTWSL